MTVARPKDAFFAEDGEMPEEVELRSEMPAKLLYVYGVKQARERIAASVERHEKAAHVKAAVVSHASRPACSRVRS